MDKWLVDLADGYLELNATQMVQAGLPARLIEPRQRELRTDLGAVVLHCKAEARRICGLRQAEREAPEKVEPSQTKTPHNGDELSKRFQKRAQWLRQALESRRWTVQDFERFGGPNAKTTRKMLDGESVRETVLERVVQGLSMKDRVTRSDIPND
jgi:hypothetical protein